MAGKTKSKASGTVPSPMDFQSILAARSDDANLADELTAIAQKQLETSHKFKQIRMDEVQKSIDLYDGKTKKALKGRWNVPLPIMSGFIDTLVSKVDDPPKVRFGYQDIADMQRAAKVQAKWEDDSSDSQGQWAAKDRVSKKVASFYGVGILKYFAYNDDVGRYRSHLEVVDPLDFECEPMGGQFLRDHKFMGQRNIFKTEAELKAGAKGENAIYDRFQLLRLIATVNSAEYKNFRKVYNEKTDRLKALGFNPDQNNYVGTKIYNLTEWYMEYDGVWYYLLFEPHSGIWVRFARLTEIFESGVPPFVAWHTHPDAFNFWSKAPADDMRPVAEGMGIIFNQMLDAREKNVYRQRAYDPDMFQDPAQLEWRPDGLVEANTNGGERAIGSGIYEFRVEGMTEAGTINLLEMMDQLTGTKTGVTASSQGATADSRVGIYYGNLQQVADRLGLYNKSYSEGWARIGWLYYWGLKEHIKSNRMMVAMIGEKGYNWVEMSKDDVDPEQDFKITISGGQSEIAQDELEKKQRADALAIVLRIPNFVQKLNPEATIEEVLRIGSWKEDSIRRLLNTQSYGSEGIISEAHQAIQDILAGRTPKRNRGATDLFIETIVDFAADAEDLDQQTWQKLMDYAKSHMAIAAFNMIRKAHLEAMLVQLSVAAGGGAAGPANGAGGGVPGGGAPAAAALLSAAGNSPETPPSPDNGPGTPAASATVRAPFTPGSTPGGTASRSAGASAQLRRGGGSSPIPGR